MKFNCDAKELMDAIESTTLKGKYKYGDGLKSKSIGDYCYMKITGNELTLQNSDNTTAVLSLIHISEPTRPLYI